MSLTLGMLAKSSSAYEAEAVTLFAAMSTQPSDTRKGLINDLILQLKTDGIWAELDVLGIFAAHNAQAALLNWKNPGTFNFAETVAPTFTADVGYTGNGSSQYLTNPFNPSTAGGQFTRDAASYFVWCNTSAQDERAIFGNAGAKIFPRWTDDFTYYRINSTADGNFANADGKGFYSVSRRSSTAIEAYKNGVSSQTTTITSEALVNDALYVLSSDGGFHSGQALCAGWGDQLSDAQHTSLYDAIHVYLQAVAGIA